MSNLYDRLFEPSALSADESPIPVHYFYAGIVDMAAGYTTSAQIVAAFELDALAQSNLTSLIVAYQASSSKDQWLQELHAVMMLAESDLKYRTKQSFANRMGL